MRKKLILLLLCSCFSHSPVAEEILLAVASNFTAPMDQLVAEFEATTEHRVQVAFGSSGRFFAQIQNGAPYQVFFSADQDKPVRLDQLGMTVPGSRFTYAIGRLALWSGNSGLEPDEGRALSNAFNRLALANPALAPYGQAALEVLEHLGLVDRTRSRWVQGENIAQVYQFVATGNADLGFVALSQLGEDGQAQADNVWMVPVEFHRPIRQDAVLLAAAADCVACQQFLNYVGSPRAQEILARFGYLPNQ